MAEKVYTFPSADELKKQLADAKLYGVKSAVGSLSTEFFDLLTSQVSERELYGEGFVMAYHLAIYDFGEKVAPVYANLINMAINFDQVVDVMIPDKDVATEAKNFMQEAKKSIEEKRRR